MGGKFNPITMPDYSDEEDETLSLRDLTVSGDDEADNRSQKDHHISSSSDRQHDHFEFFNEEWSTTTNTADNILFCGKLIANKEHKVPIVSDNPQKMLMIKHQRKRTDLGLLRQNFMSSTSKTYGEKGKHFNSGSRLSYSPSFNDEKLRIDHNNMVKCDDKNVLAQRITILKSPTRSNWFLFLFGSARITTGMEIRDIRKRQNKKSLRQSSGGGGSTIKSAGKGWWRIIRALGCSTHHHADAVIKVAHGRAPVERE